MAALCCWYIIILSVVFVIDFINICYFSTVSFSIGVIIITVNSFHVIFTGKGVKIGDLDV